MSKGTKDERVVFSISAAVFNDSLHPVFLLHLSYWLASANVTVNSLCMLMLPAVLHHIDFLQLCKCLLYY